MTTRLRDPHHLEIVDESRKAHAIDPSPFDRLAFARRVLSILQPENWTVALYRRTGSFHADRVRDLRRGPDAVWATIGIPATASREEIALVLTRLMDKPGRPYLLQALSTADADRAPVVMH